MQSPGAGVLPADRADGAPAGLPPGQAGSRLSGKRTLVQLRRDVACLPGGFCQKKQIGSIFMFILCGLYGLKLILTLSCMGDFQTYFKVH